MDETVRQELGELNKYYKEQEDVYRNYALRIGFPETALWVLYAVAVFEGPATQHDLCCAFLYSKQTINSAVNKLIQEGYVLLAAIPGKGNRKEILLTEKGKKFCREKINPLLRAEEEAYMMLGEKKRKQFLRLSGEYVQNMTAQVERIKF